MKKRVLQIRITMLAKKIVFSTFLLFGFYMNGLHSQDSIVPAGSIITKLSSDQFQFLEGPVWYNDSVLLFVEDGMAGTGSDIYKYDPVSNQIIKWPSNSTHCVGLSCDKDGNLIGASMNILMINEAGQLIKTLASEYNGKPFDNPNDLIADDKGGVYFTDPDFFLIIPPQDKTAVYYIDSTGNVIRVIDDLAEPNGIILSPDGTKLYVVDSDNKYVYSWDVAPDGSVSGKLSLAELQTLGGDASGADGMAIDINGNIYVASEKGIQIFSPQGTAITTIVLPEIPSNCDFGGRDFKTLYITAHTNDFSYSNLYSIDLNYPGYAVSRKTSPNGISIFPDRPSVEIYPNPVQNVLHINLPGKTGTLEVFDNSGKSLIQKEIRENNNSIDISSLIDGIYLVQVWSDNKLSTGKIVKY